MSGTLFDAPARFVMSSIPTHLIAAPGDRRSLCGVKDPLPVMWAAKVEAHRKNYTLEVCAECEEKTR